MTLIPSNLRVWFFDGGEGLGKVGWFNDFGGFIAVNGEDRHPVVRLPIPCMVFVRVVRPFRHGFCPDLQTTPAKRLLRNSSCQIAYTTLLLE